MDSWMHRDVDDSALIHKCQNLDFLKAEQLPDSLQRAHTRVIGYHHVMCNVRCM